MDCGLEKQGKYSKKYYKQDWRCHHCAMVHGHKVGKFKITKNTASEDGKRRISEAAKACWKDPEYRKKWKASSVKTKESRSKKSKELWVDKARLQKLSNSLKLAWQNTDYRNIKSKQSADLWLDNDYIKKQSAGMAKLYVRELISKNSLLLWQNEQYREKILARIITQDLRDKLAAATTALNTDRWNDVLFRAKLMRTFRSSEFISKMTEINKEILSRPDVRAKLSAYSKKRWLNTDYREKISANNKKRWLNTDYREKMAIARAAQSGKTSSIQKQLYAFLDDLGVVYLPEGPETRIGYFVFDCLVKSKNNRDILIECQGDYWHTLVQAKSRDKSKFTYINRYFPEYEIMYIWEHEFYCKDRVLDRLKLKLGINIETVDFKFNDIIIKSVNSNEIKSFLDSYHYIGIDRGGVCYGAYLNDQLVACITFSPPLRQNTAGQFGLVDGEVRELSRLCVHPSYHKKNFASWFVSHCLKLIDAKLVIAYADTTVGHIGTTYQATNFILHHKVPADYWYVDKDGFVIHKRTLYGRAVKMGIKEAEFAEKFGYIKKYGGEKICYIYQRR
jgi:GNAT superfamily N-acetyltransferase